MGGGIAITVLMDNNYYANNTPDALGKQFMITLLMMFIL